MLRWVEDEDQPVETNLKRALHQWNAVLGLYASALYRRPIKIPFEPPVDLLLQLRTEISQQSD